MSGPRSLAGSLQHLVWTGWVYNYLPHKRKAEIVDGLVPLQCFGVRREEGNTSYGDYIGIVFPYSLLSLIIGITTLSPLLCT